MTISYTTKRGGYMRRRIDPRMLPQEIAKLVKRGIECEVLDDDGSKVGEIWKQAGRWEWFYDASAMTKK